MVKKPNQKKKKKEQKVAILTSEKTDFKNGKRRPKKSHYIMIKGSIHQEDIMSINIYAPNIRAPKYTKQILTELKGEINSNTIIVGDFKYPTLNKWIDYPENQ